MNLFNPQLVYSFKFLNKKTGKTITRKQKAKTRIVALTLLIQKIKDAKNLVILDVTTSISIQS